MKYTLCLSPKEFIKCLYSKTRTQIWGQKSIILIVLGYHVLGHIPVVQEHADFTDIQSTSSSCYQRADSEELRPWYGAILDVWKRLNALRAAPDTCHSRHSLTSSSALQLPFLSWGILTWFSQDSSLNFSLSS